METTHKKKILLGVTGGIAAYKSAELVRLLIKAGKEVRVVMTQSAREFIQPLTFQALSGHRVYTDVFDSEADSAMDHIELARWADLIVVAPATADFIAKLRNGYSDNLLLTLCLACQHPVAIAPAMNQQMYANQATLENIEHLVKRGSLVWGPASGEQACGDIGPGRMLEPAIITEMIESHFKPGRLSGMTILITAGPTREAIDPVRYISNRSSGKMGYALAQAASEAGALVTLVSGPVSLTSPAQVTRIPVTSADEMRIAVMEQVEQADIFIGCAAVADYRIDQIADQKIKKSDQTMQLNLSRNPDILSEVAHLPNKPFTVGFAAETEKLEQHAMGKLERKKLDMIAANLVSAGDKGFENSNNELLVLWPGGRHPLPLTSKRMIAQQLIELIAEQYIQQKQN